MDIFFYTLICVAVLIFSAIQLGKNDNRPGSITREAQRYFKFAIAASLIAMLFINLASGVASVVLNFLAVAAFGVSGFFASMGFKDQQKVEKFTRERNLPNRAWYFENYQLIDRLPKRENWAGNEVDWFAHLQSEHLRHAARYVYVDWENSNQPLPIAKFLEKLEADPKNDLLGMINAEMQRFREYSDEAHRIRLAIFEASRALPQTELLKLSRDGARWSDYLKSNSNSAMTILDTLPEKMGFILKELRFKVTIPYELRVQHHHIVAPTGHGKTTLLQDMILKDMETDASVILIDSDGGIIENLLRAVDPERLVLIDPMDIEFPVALNLFDVGWDRIEQYSPLDREMATNGVLELFDFVMASLLGAELTSKQSTAFRYVTRLMLTVPGATILDFLKLFEPGGLAPYRDYIDDMGETAQSFFNNEFEGSEFKATKKQILRRLYGLLENQTFARMFSNPKTKLNIFDEMGQGKIILINTAYPLLKKEASQIMGRFFIAMIAQAAQERSSQKDRRRTYFYIDEADEYFDDTMITILAKARKYELGLIIAHQHLAQLPAKLAAALAANTAIKFAGGKTVSDATAMSKLMFTTPDRIQSLPVGTFLGYVKGHDAFPYVVPEDPFAGHELATDEEMKETRGLMRERYAYPASDLKKPKTVRTPKADPDDVEEVSTWSDG